MNVKMAKLVTGEVVVGKLNEADNTLVEVVVLQPTTPQQQQQGQGNIMLLPYGVPFTQKIEAKISLAHAIMVYQEVIGDIQEKYLELMEKARQANAL